MYDEKDFDHVLIIDLVYTNIKENETKITKMNIVRFFTCLNKDLIDYTLDSVGEVECDENNLRDWCSTYQIQNLRYDLLSNNCRKFMS